MKRESLPDSTAANAAGLSTRSVPDEDLRIILGRNSILALWTAIDQRAADDLEQDNWEDDFEDDLLYGKGYFDDDAFNSLLEAREIYAY